MKAGPTLLDEHITYIQRIFQTLPLVKFSITWVNRGQWEKNKYPHLSRRSQPSIFPSHTPTHTHKPSDTRCQPIWLPVRESHPPRQVPFFAKNHFPRHVRYGDINECTMTVLREASSYPASANLPAGHFCTTRKKKLWKQTGAGQKLISSPRLKTHLSKQRSVIEADSRALHANEGVIRHMGREGGIQMWGW